MYRRRGDSVLLALLTVILQTRHHRAQRHGPLAVRGESPARPSAADGPWDRSDETAEYGEDIRRVSSTKSPRPSRQIGPRGPRHGLLASRWTAYLQQLPILLHDRSPGE